MESMPTLVQWPFVDGTGAQWFVQPVVRPGAGGAALGLLRFVSEDGRILLSAPVAFAERADDLAGWESGLTAPVISRALATAQFEGAFSRAAH